MMLFLLNDYSEQVSGPGIAPLPAKASKRRRTVLLPGSCGFVQPLPSTAGDRVLPSWRLERWMKGCVPPFASPGLVWS